MSKFRDRAHREPDDVSSCVEVLRQVHRMDSYPTRWPRDPCRFIAPTYETTAWVALGSDLVVGHVALHDAVQDPAYPTARAASATESLAAVGRLFTRVGYRGLRLGASLLRTTVTAAHETGQQPFLNVARHLDHAIWLYEQERWKNLGPLTIKFSDGSCLDVLAFLGPPPGRGA